MSKPVVTRMAFGRSAWLGAFIRVNRHYDLLLFGVRLRVLRLAGVIGRGAGGNSKMGTSHFHLLPRSRGSITRCPGPSSFSHSFQWQRPCRSCSELPVS